MPALQVNDGWKTEQTCRLYPKSDSLTCQYYEDSGKKQKGQYGYCLEYDRYPGDDSACLLWWPVDIVKGQGIEEGAGYKGKYPVYYTIGKSGESMAYTAPDDFRMYNENSHCETITTADLGLEEDDDWQENYKIYSHENILNGIVLDCPSLNNDSNTGGDMRRLLNKNNDWTVTMYEHGGDIPSGPEFDQNCGGGNACDYCGECGNCFRIQAFFRGGYFSHIQYLTGDDSNDTSGWRCSVKFNFNRIYADKIAQTVSPTGRNKYWSARVYKGSDFNLPCNPGIPGTINTCTYITDDEPFGSVALPGYSWSRAANPYEWDGNEDQAGKQPLYYKPPVEMGSDGGQEPRMGQEFYAPYLQQIFAQSYGMWEWNGSAYVPIDEGWTPPDEQCSGAQRPDFRLFTYSCIEESGMGDDCRFDYLEAPQTPSNPGDDYYIHEASIPITSVTMNWPSITRENAYEVYAKKDDGYSWEYLTSPEDIGGQVPAPDGCGGRYPDPAVKVDIGNNTSWDAVKYLKFVKIGPNEDDCEGASVDSPGLVGYELALTESGADYCAIPPRVDNDYNNGNGNGIQINGQIGAVPITGSNFVNLTFNSLVDSQQLPLVMYAVDWGDGNETVVSGAEMRDRPNERKHSLYHLYSYWDLRNKAGMPGVNCNSSFCSVSPRIKVKDNWDWCNGPENNGASLSGRNDCDNWVSFNGKVRVYKK
jgi:hypothetical protein